MCKHLQGSGWKRQSSLIGPAISRKAGTQILGNIQHTASPNLVFHIVAIDAYMQGLELGTDTVRLTHYVLPLLAEILEEEAGLTALALALASAQQSSSFQSGLDQLHP